MAKSLFVNPTDVDRIVKENDLQYLFLLGMRSNGKSSAVKALRLQKFLETGEKFAYIRRYSSVDMKAYRINSYFASVPGFDIKAISKGKYECIDVMVDLFGVEEVKIWSKITAFKYLWRLGEKDDVIQEAKK